MFQRYIYRVPKQTVLDKIKYKYSQDCRRSSVVLRTEKENLIVKWVCYLAEIGFPVTNNQLVSCVTNLVKKLNRPNFLKNNIPSKKWMQGFLNRNSTMSQSVSQCLKVYLASVTESSIRSGLKRINQYFENHICFDV